MTVLTATHQALQPLQLGVLCALLHLSISDRRLGDEQLDLLAVLKKNVYLICLGSAMGMTLNCVHTLHAHCMCTTCTFVVEPMQHMHENNDHSYCLFIPPFFVQTRQLHVGGGVFWMRPSHPTSDPARPPPPRRPSYNSVGSIFCEPNHHEVCGKMEKNRDD